MNDAERPPIDPSLLGALRADFAPVARAPRERIAQHLSNSVGALTLGHALPNGRASAKGHWLRASAPSLVSSFVIGGLCGALVYGSLRPTAAPRVVYVERAAASAALPMPAPSVSSAAPSTPSASLEPEPEPPANAATPRSATPGAAAAARSGLADLAEQQALLDQARTAFARSDYRSTLALLHTHHQRFPKSVLGEERAALEIKALAASGRTAEAQARATRFTAQFPQSLLLPSVNDSLHDNP